MRRAGWAVAALSALLLVVPVTSDGGERFDCGTAATAALGLTRPPDGLVDVGLDVAGEPLYVSRFATCRRAGIGRMILSAEVAVVAAVVLVVGRRRSTAEDRTPVPVSIER